MATQPIALVADASIAAIPLAEALREQGWNVIVATSAGNSLEGLAEHSCELLVLGHGLGNDVALSLLETVRNGSTEGRLLPAVVVFDGASSEQRLKAMQLGADVVLECPIQTDVFRARTQRLWALRQHVAGLNEQIEALHRLSVTDGLTQVFNHRYFQSRLKEEFRRAQRYEENLSLMLIDLDHFKQVNDLFGHQAGDLVLREVALAIKANLRDTDVVARYGGEEFGVLLPKTHLTGALVVAERVWAGVAGVKTGPDRNHPITLSIGVSVYPGEDVDTPESLLQTADEALYSAKRTGRNRIVSHPPTASFSKRASGQL